MSNKKIKIVKVGAQEYSVPADTENEALRTTLAPNFPEVASATISISSREVEGYGVVEVVEFVKKAGTKGLTTSLLRALDGVQPFPVPTQLSPLLTRLLAGEMEVQEVLVQLEALQVELHALEAAQETQQGVRLCHALDNIPAVATNVDRW